MKTVTSLFAFFLLITPIISLAQVTEQPSTPLIDQAVNSAPIARKAGVSNSRNINPADIPTESPDLAGEDASEAKAMRCVQFGAWIMTVNGFKKEWSSCCTSSGEKMRGCWKNDHAEGMRIYGPKGTEITVYDSPSGSTGDDYFTLTKLDGSPVYVWDFESPYTSGGEVYWFYSGGNGLNGKVSRFFWSDPW